VPILVVSAALVAATGLLLSWRLADGGMTQWLVGAYVISFTEIVLVSLLLSIGSHLTRWTLLGTLAAVFVVAVAAAPRRRPNLFPGAGTALLQALRDPPIAAFALVVLGVVGYSIALGLFRPPNDEDALAYHLARAAFWKQQDGIGYIPGAADARLNEFAPNSEIVMAFTMITSGSGRYAPLVELTAALAAALAVFGIARRIGLTVREALFGGLLFVTLPAVALQMSTGLNDVAVASLVASVAFFLLRSTPPNLVLGGLAVALVVGMKLTGILALPGLALIVLTAHRRRAWRVLAALAISAGAGCYWYLLNVVRGGAAFGGIGGERVGTDVAAAASRVLRLLLATVELPGAIGLDRLFYVAAAAVLAAALVVGRGTPQARRARAALGAGAILIPLALVPLDHLILRGSQKLFFELGRADVGYLDSHRSATKASPIFSWYGPLGVVLTAFSLVVAIRAVRRRRLPSVAVVLAAAPILWIVLLGVGVPYWEWNGRYTMGGFALGTATWGVVLRVRPLAWATVALAFLATSLAFVHLHDRPSGLRLIEATHEQSVWSQPAWSIQATDHPHLRALYRFADEQIPSHARLAIEPEVWPLGTASGGNLPPFPFFGRDLTRTIVFARSPRAAAGAHAEWAVLRRDGIGRCVRGWGEELWYGNWLILRRSPGSTCA